MFGVLKCSVKIFQEKFLVRDLGFSRFMACVLFIQPHVTAVDKDTQGPASTLQKILHGNALQSFHSAFVCFAQELHEMLKSDPERWI